MKSDSFLADVGRILVSNVGSQVLAVVSIPVLARAYDPATFGGWAIVQSLFLLITPLATLRLELAVMLPKLLKHSYVLCQLVIINTCFISGWDLLAIEPTTLESTGTFLHPKIFKFCLLISFSKTLIQWFD